MAALPGKLTPGWVRGATSTKSPIANRGFSSGVVLGRSLPFDRYGAEAGADASSGFLSSEARLAFFGGAFLSEPPDDERRRALGAVSASAGFGDCPFGFSAGSSAAGGLGGDRAAGGGDSRCGRGRRRRDRRQRGLGFGSLGSRRPDGFQKTTFIKRGRLRREGRAHALWIRRI